MALAEAGLAGMQVSVDASYPDHKTGSTTAYFMEICMTARPIIFSAPMIRALTFEMIYKNVDKVTA